MNATFKAMISNPMDPMDTMTFPVGTHFEAGDILMFQGNPWIIQEIEPIDQDGLEQCGLEDTEWAECLLDITCTLSSEM